jgi:exopolysaccharide biosynthesis polyprenyl glycosylphosphotransferase
VAINLRRRLVEFDAVCIAVSWLVVLTFGVTDDRIDGGLLKVTAETAAFTALGLGMLVALRMYRSRVTTVRSVTLERTALISVVLAGCAWAVERTSVTHPSIAIPAAGGVLTFLTLSTTRACFDAWATLRRRDGSLNRPVVLVGSGNEIIEMTDLLLGHPEIGCRPAGYMSDEQSSAHCLEELHWLGPISRGAEAVYDAHATGAIIAANGIGSPELNRLVRELHDAGLHVQLSSGLWHIGHRRLRQLPLAHEPFFYLEPPALRRTELAVKRAIDVVGASLVLAVTSPVVAIAALLIKLGDGGPVMFKQARVGQHGEEVTIHKLRTMTCDAEARLDALRAQNDRSGPLFKMADDPRVTRVGRWLRASSIDELPQLYDVLIGRLSLVGPRPALAAEVESFDEELMERQRIRPGVTGLWQVEARHNSSFYAYRHLDLFYLENWSLGLDAAIIAATVVSLASDVYASVGRIFERRRRPNEANEATLDLREPASDHSVETAGSGGLRLPALASISGPTAAPAPVVPLKARSDTDPDSRVTSPMRFN